MLKTKTAKEWEKIFFDVGIPVGMVNNTAQAISHPQVRTRNMAVSIKQPEDDEIWEFAGNPIKIVETPETFKPAPGSGADTEEILLTILGYSKEYIAQLEETSVCFVGGKK